MENKAIRKNDIYLIIGFLLVFLLIVAAIHFTKSKGNMVQVSVDGTVTETFPLSEDLTVTIEGYGKGTNVLVISDGKCCLKDTSCPDHLCEKMGMIDSVGQSIICLPNRVVVEVIGDDTDAEYDAVVGG